MFNAPYFNAPHKAHPNPLLSAAIRRHPIKQYSDMFGLTAGSILDLATT
jgi:hypothetical protein